MLKSIILLPILVACGVAQKSEDYWPKNVITVPPNCPVGQQWVNGECRDIWRNLLDALEYVLKERQNYDDLKPNNMITVPTNCKPGQQWVNGQCRDIWRQNGVLPANVVTVPPNCPPGQEYVNGECRIIWRSPSVLLEKIMYRVLHALKNEEENEIIEEVPVKAVKPLDIKSLDKNIINVPNQCPVGFRPDALGFCRPIFGETL